MSVHVIRITLRDSTPPLWWRMAVPSDITLGQLHEAIQIAMGWTNSHLHQFVLRDESLKPTFAPLGLYQIADQLAVRVAGVVRMSSLMRYLKQVPTQ